MDHPDDKLLQQYCAGKLPKELEEQIEQHILSCVQCDRHLDQIEQNYNKKSLDIFKKANNYTTTKEINSNDLLCHQYLKVKLLGRGGMGEVWKAYDTVAKRDVVLKFVPHNIEHYDETRKMFFESFEKVHNLHHQNICPLYAVSIDPKYGPFLVMQYIDGISLSQYYKNKAGKGGLSFSTTLSILREIAVALDFAHSRKIIHRDIKPQNIMISRTEGVQIIDFGIADYIRTDIRTTDFDLTNQRSGTRLYMAPEQWEGKKQDARTDQYSLAVLAYELLSGKVPFNIQDIEILRRCVLNDHPEILKSQSAAVNAALQKALAKNRKDRFDTCLAFVDALEENTCCRLPNLNTLKTILVVFLVLLLLIISLLLLDIHKRNSKTEKMDPSVKTVTPFVPPFAPDTASAPKNAESSKTSPVSDIDDKEDNKSVNIDRASLSRRNELLYVIRVLIFFYNNGFCTLTIDRVASITPLPILYYGIQTDLNIFSQSKYYINKNSDLKYLAFPEGYTVPVKLEGLMAGNRQIFDNSISSVKLENGWSYKGNGNRFNHLSKYTEFWGLNTELTMSKTVNGLPFAFVYETLEKDQCFPNIHLMLSNNNNKTIGQLLLDGTKIKNDRLLINAKYIISADSIIPSDPNSDQTIEQLEIDSHSTFSKQFGLNSASRVFQTNQINKITFSLTGHNNGDFLNKNNKPVFSLTYLGMLGNF